MAQLTLDVPTTIMERLQQLAVSEKKTIQAVAVEHLAQLDQRVAGDDDGASSETSTDLGIRSASDIDFETRTWLESDLERELPPYNWDGINPLSLGFPVRYLPQLRFVVAPEEPESNASTD